MEINDRDIIIEFSECVLTVAANDFSPSEFKKDTTLFLTRFILDKTEISKLNEEVTVEELCDIDTKIKKCCTNFINDELKKMSNPLLDYSSKRLENYKQELMSFFEKQLNVQNFPWLLNHIIDTIDLQFAEFEFIYSYNKQYNTIFSNLETRHSELETILEKIEPLIKQANENAVAANEKADTSLKTINDAIKKVNNLVKNSDSAIQKANDAVNKSNDSVKKVDVAVEKVDVAVEKVEKATLNTVETVITILGIFASIILTYHGVLTFTSSVLESMNNVSIYRAILMVLLVGIVGISLTFILLYYLNTFRKKSKSIAMLIVYILAIIVLLCLVAGTIVSWYNGWVEDRNSQFNKDAVDCDNHSFGDWIIVNEPTCTEEGSKQKSCMYCGEILETEIIIAVGHYFETIIDKLPTCTEEGTKHQQCTNCNEIGALEIITAIGHNFETVIDKQPTYTEEGISHKECTNCGEVTVPEILAAIGQ